MSEREINQRLAERIRGAGGLGDENYRPGDHLALLDGQIVAAARDLAGALLALRALDSDPKRGMIVEASPPVLDVIR